MPVACKSEILHFDQDAFHAVDRRVIGTQTLHLLNQTTAWHVSTISESNGSYETHLTRLLKHTRLERMHWINLNKCDVSLKTLRG